MERKLYTGIDLHKLTSTLVTVDEAGTIVAHRKLKNETKRLRKYFSEMSARHLAVVEATAGWYWVDDVLSEEGVDLKLAHAKQLKAISYAKVKTDKVDAKTLAQLLRVDLIPEAHKISRDRRGMRDIMRARLRLVTRRTSCLNSIERIFEKHKVKTEEELPSSARLQLDGHRSCAEAFALEIKTLEQSLNGVATSDADVQRLLWIPGIGHILSLTILFEIDDISRFESEKRFYSYCRLVPGSNDSGGKHRHKRSKDGNRYLKLAFSTAAVQAIRHYPEIRAVYRRLLKKKCAPVARAIIAKELAHIVYEVLRRKEDYDHMFKGRALSRTKSHTWPRLAPQRAC